MIQKMSYKCMKLKQKKNATFQDVRRLMTILYKIIFNFISQFVEMVRGKNSWQISFYVMGPKKEFIFFNFILKLYLQATRSFQF
jgi:hypothetical protein